MSTTSPTRCVFLMERYSGESHVNVGWGSDVTIAELARLDRRRRSAIEGGFRYATDKPDGAPRKLLDVRRLDALGWRPRIALREGLADAYRWFDGERRRLGVTATLAAKSF